MNSTQVEYDTLIPNNVNLSSDKKVLKALENGILVILTGGKILDLLDFKNACLFKNCNKCG